MKVKELIKNLSDFNPLAEVVLISDSVEEKIRLGGWLSCDGDSCDEKHRNIENEKATSVKVYLHLENEVMCQEVGCTLNKEKEE